MILVSADLLPSNVTIDAVYDIRQIFFYFEKNLWDVFVIDMYILSGRLQCYMFI